MKSVHVPGEGTQYVEWFYPDIYKGTSRLVVNLSHVRAADGLGIRYDSERDGWVIEQHPFVEHDGWSEPVGDWTEVAFVKAWALERPKTDSVAP